MNIQSTRTQAFTPYRPQETVAAKPHQASPDTFTFSGYDDDGSGIYAASMALGATAAGGYVLLSGAPIQAGIVLTMMGGVLGAGVGMLLDAALNP